MSTDDAARPDPSAFRYHRAIAVRYADTDAQGHVFFANYLTYFDEAFTGYLHAVGCPPRELLAEGCDFVYAEARCQYRSPARFEDTVLVHVRAGRVGNTSVTFEFAAFSRDAAALLASGTLVTVCVAPVAHTPVRVPERLRAALARFEADRAAP